MEHDGIRTIIIANEYEIIDENYSKIKEKLIGRTLEFSLNHDDLIPSLIRTVNKDHARQSFISDQSSLVHDLYNSGGYENLRSLKFSLIHLGNILDSCDEKVLKKKDAVQNIILFTLALAFEFKAGKINTREKLKELATSSSGFSLDDFLGIGEARKSKTKEKALSVNQEFRDKYHKPRGMRFYYFEAIANYILFGYLDTKALDNDLLVFFPKRLSKIRREIQNIYNYRDLENSRFEKSCEYVLMMMERGKVSLVEYVNLSQFFFHFIDISILKLSHTELKAIAIQGIAIAKKKATWTNELDFRLSDFKKDNPSIEHLEIIRDLVLKANLEIGLSTQAKKVKSLETLFFRRFQLFLKEVRNSDSEFLTRPLFTDTSGEVLFEYVLKMNNKKLSQFHYILRRRYDGLTPELGEDFSCLLELSKKVENYLTKLNDSTNAEAKKINVLILEDISIYLKEMLERYSD